MEIFGATASALSVAALFNNCVDCFEYIQIGRQFGQDFERYQIKLDVARTRLGRWGQAVGIDTDPRFTTDMTVDEVSQQVHVLLEEIMLLFHAVQKSSKRYELQTPREDLVCFTNAEMRPEFRKLHGQLEAIAHQRQRHTSLVKKARWALYDSKYLEKLVREIADFVDALEKLVPPAEAVQRQLSAMELEEVEDESSLLALRDAAVDTDSILSETVDQKIGNILARNHVKRIRGGEDGNVWVGNEWNTDYINGFGDQTQNTVDSIRAKDFETKDNFGRTPLSFASEHGHEAIIKLLLAKGADFETRGIHGYTPLSYAAERGHETVVKLLLEKSAHLEVKDKYGLTPLLWAAGMGHETVVRLLLEEGADPKAENNDGKTPLFFATELGHQAVINLLLEKGADFEMENS